MPSIVYHSTPNGPKECSAQQQDRCKFKNGLHTSDYAEAQADYERIMDRARPQKRLTKTKSRKDVSTKKQPEKSSQSKSERERIQQEISKRKQKETKRDAQLKLLNPWSGGSLSKQSFRELVSSQREHKKKTAEMERLLTSPG